jgi:aryl-alcohol dehydrogenase-like predicted oxidoreductase
MGCGGGVERGDEGVRFVSLARELGVGVVPSSPLVRCIPRFGANAFAANLAAVELVKEIAAAPAALGRIVLAWLRRCTPGLV